MNLPLRTRAGIAAGSSAGWLSRLTGRGTGGTLPGRLLVAADPQALQRLAHARTSYLVSGTNGKTTTTRLIAAALGTRTSVLTNADGSNLAAGVATALLRDQAGRYPTAVFEVDELALPRVAAAVAPAAVVLLNLSRDQLDRMTEVGSIVEAWRRMLLDNPPGVVIANADDPLVALAAMVAADAGRPVIWTAVGQPWLKDVAACPRCANAWQIEPGRWSCAHCGFSRPEPAWRLDGDLVHPPDGPPVPLQLALPGRANRANATTALAAAAHFGVPVAEALAAMSTVTDVAGRYRVIEQGGRQLRLLLAKNPAGWLEMLEQVGGGTGPVITVLNARGADGRDPSWIWDVPFEQLRDRPAVWACGERSADLSVRLTYGDIQHSTVADPLEAVGALPMGPCDIIANYTAFTRLLRTLKAS